VVSAGFNCHTVLAQAFKLKALFTLIFVAFLQHCQGRNIALNPSTVLIAGTRNEKYQVKV
jgi:hypothetical protein